ADRVAVFKRRTERKRGGVHDRLCALPGGGRGRAPARAALRILAIGADFELLARTGGLRSWRADHAAAADGWSFVAVDRVVAIGRELGIHFFRPGGVGG